ncbi:hypothetical protein [Microbacterium sp. NPDC056052]|uniref:hypothetical protein n=1 Tax=Microbacterium sp. NPDC056052 TaxID=3345695 RepID=UPI0035E285B9
MSLTMLPAASRFTAPVAPSDGRLIAVAAMVGLVAVVGLVFAVWVRISAVTATGMETLMVPVLVFLGAFALAGGIGCAVLIPRILKSRARRAATTFVALTLLPGLFVLWVALPTVLFGHSRFEAIPYLLPLPITVATLVLLLLPGTKRAFASEQTAQ